MKKTYINPVMKIVNVKINRLMNTTSLGYGGVKSDISGDARGGQAWDDED